MDFNIQRINEIKSFVKDTKQQLSTHPIYSEIATPEELKIFMESHVFAVWDFMSLVKFLQLKFTSVRVPWIPPSDSSIARLINEIVLDEESDIDQHGNPTSHFELYTDAMNQFGANTNEITGFINNLRHSSLSEAIAKSALPMGVQEFIKTTFSFVNKASTHEVVAVFTFGREEIIPDMFIAMINQLNESTTHSLDTFIYYLDRHIELDGGKHNELCFQMLTLICGNDDEKWNSAKIAAKKAMEARVQLWNNISKQVNSVEVA